MNGPPGRAGAAGPAENATAGPAGCGEAREDDRGGGEAREGGGLGVGGTRREVSEAAGRGALTIADRVLEKIASVAAGEVEHVGGPRGETPRRSWPARAASRGHSRPRASVHGGGQAVRVRLALSVDYPAPVGQVCEQVRSSVAARLRELAGVRLVRVDITVAAFTSAYGHTGRVR